MRHTHHPTRRRSARPVDVPMIRAKEIRYPGANLPAANDDEYEEWRAGGRRFRPALDTGLAIEGRAARQRRLARRAMMQRLYVSAAVVVVMCVSLIAWRNHSDEHATGGLFSNSSAKTASARAADPKVEPKADPTPVFASYGSLQLRLPVSVTDLTEIGFHQASYTYALHMTTSLADADMTAAKRDKTTNRDKSAQETGPAAVLTGSVLRMWRSRPGKPDSAVDVGGKAGSDVLAPISGTVVKVKSYKLYNKYADYEIHIRPNGFDDIDCVMIHIDDVSCEPGDEVTAGVTRIGVVRLLSDRVDHQLGDYTLGGGDHTHIQLNNITDSRYKGLEGAIAVDGS